MSDLSIIAHDYALNADFARKFNEAVLTLKRRYLVRRIDPNTEPHIAEVRAELGVLLRSLIVALQDGGKPYTADQARVPFDLLDRLRKRLKGEVGDAVVRYQEIVDTLAGSAPLAAPAFETLDVICEAADATASASFRRMRRI